MLSQTIWDWIAKLSMLNQTTARSEIVFDEWNLIYIYKLQETQPQNFRQLTCINNKVTRYAITNFTMMLEITTKQVANK